MATRRPRWHHRVRDDDIDLRGGRSSASPVCTSGTARRALSIAQALPLTYLGDGLRQVMVDGTPFAPLWVCFAFLAVWLAFCFGIAARFFKWQ